VGEHAQPEGDTEQMQGVRRAGPPGARRARVAAERHCHERQGQGHEWQRHPRAQPRKRRGRDVLGDFLDGGALDGNKAHLQGSARAARANHVLLGEPDVGLPKWATGAAFELQLGEPGGD